MKLIPKLAVSVTAGSAKTWLTADRRGDGWLNEIRIRCFELGGYAMAHASAGWRISKRGSSYVIGFDVALFEAAKFLAGEPVLDKMKDVADRAIAHAQHTLGTKPELYRAVRYGLNQLREKLEATACDQATLQSVDNFLAKLDARETRGDFN